MQRRKYLATIGAFSVTGALAGCTEEETTTASSNGDDGDDSGDSDDGDDSGDSDDGGDENEGLVIEEHELVQDDYTIQIEGILLNDTGEEQSYVEVKSTVYDEDDVRIDDFLANTTGLPHGEKWRFEIFVNADAEEIDRYEIEASTGF